MLVAPKVSVVMITYQHEKYIQQAIEGVLMQECNFVVELIIADDCSPDNTEEIVKKIIKEHPKGNWIKYTKHPKNKGMMPNFIWALQQAKGKYIALCEGDDYWTDPLKLQKQVDFLEGNEEVSLCFHPTTLKIEGALKQNSSMFIGLEQRVYNGKDILLNWIIPTASVVFKSKSLLPAFFERMINPNYIYGDIILLLSIAETGTLFCLNDNMSVYRRHKKGVTQDKVDIEFYEKLYKHREAIANDFNGKYSYLKKYELSKCYFSLALYYLKKFKVKGVKFMIKALRFNSNVLFIYIKNKYN